ncbi:uncharacterized protein LOC129412157 [Boleophthalmus pectinirostris]|uniref:uncharacterized protein LOC129412157 n=1 Tax=Boleophthalmus pectinirostris TaxID=150288 RepID=UPI00242C30D5|nr:uncharacterized protein LOC129412157 [Boleophthalmus pectinirostris]
MGRGEVRPQVDKVEAIMNCHVLAKKKRSPLIPWPHWVVSRFVPQYATIAAPLTALTMKNQRNPVNWTEECEQAFSTLKTILCSSPVLKSPDFDERFRVQVDASAVGLGAVLVQGEPGEERPILYLSRKLQPRETRYSAIEKEGLAIRWALDHLRYYLLGREFDLETDHRALTWIESMKDHNSRLTRNILLKDVRENDFKTFGHSKVFSELVSDLKDLEETGILTSRGTVRGTLYCIAGDNLGSHCIGGFSENFSSSQYFCRYCLVTRDEFQSDNPNVCGPLRTTDKYNDAIERLQNEDAAEGVKFNSIFNSLHHFHVCQPGLPPCLGHDIFEGILAYDVALYLKYFIKKKKWFTYSTLNRRIYQFKYCLSDASSKPCQVKPLAKKLSGQAIQNWNFLRLLPVIIGDKVKDTTDDVWQLTLQLKDVVDMVCAQKISVSQVAFLDVLIQEYLESRKALFPSTTLKPKHHYLRHYPALILKFGPLIRLWTMRFESKHSYFKTCARNLKNFKNLCFTLSQRHQMLQAYLSAGSLGQAVLQVEDSSPFYVALYSQVIQDAVREFGFTEINTKVTVKMSYKEMDDREQSNIRRSIAKVLPDLPGSLLNIVEETLQSIGVETTEDFQFV